MFYLKFLRKFQWLNDDEDQCVWLPEPRGNFSVISAWNQCRVHSSRLVLGSKMTHSIVPLHWAIILWRAIQDKLPFEDNLQKKGGAT